MSDDATTGDEPGDELSPAIAAMLGRAELWDDPPQLEDAVVAAISGQPISLDAARRRRTGGAIPRWLGAVAAIAVVAAAGALVIRAVGGDTTETAGVVDTTLTGTELAPGASATAAIESTPAGLRIILDVTGLPGAGPDEMYEAWVSDGQLKVSAGSFHLRRGNDPIALWAGVADPSFHILTVTLEPVDGVAESSGHVVLTGEFQLPDDAGQ